jgi:hypothetical protein
MLRIHWLPAVVGLAAVLVGGVQPTLARADTRTVASAYGDMSVFILNVAAGNDGVPQQPDAEQTFKDAFSNQFATLYASLSADDQQALDALPLLDAQIHQVWPNLPVDQRLALRNDWASSVQNMVADAPCDLFDGMGRAQLLPSFDAYKQTNVARLRQCWRDHPELTRDSQERASVSGSPVTAGVGDHATYMAMFNANMLSFTAGMNTASMGTATYTWK